MRRMIRWAVITAMMTVGMFAVAVPSYADRYLSVPAYVQEKSNWCWAAAGQMVVRYRTGNLYSQCTLVKKGLNSSTCSNSTGSIYLQISRILMHGNMYPGLVYDGMHSNSVLRGEIDSSRPTMLRIGWRSCNLSCGHMLVAFGYVSTSTHRWIDPLDGLKYRGTHTYLKSNTRWVTTHTRYQMT